MESVRVSKMRLNLPIMSPGMSRKLKNAKRVEGKMGWVTNSVVSPASPAPPLLLVS